jgi:hypothetical protein
MNFKSIENYLKKNYKFVIIICLFLFLITEQPEKFTPRGGHRVKDQEDFTPIEALDAVKSTETKVNNMATKVGADHVDLKSGIRLSKNWKNGANATNSEISNDIGHYKKLMVIGNKSSGTRKVGIWDHLDVHGTERVSGNFRAGRVDSDGNINGKKIESSGDVKGKRLCIGGTCIDENRLKVLAGKKHFFLRAIGKGGVLSDHGHGKFQGNKGSWEQMKIEL